MRGRGGHAGGLLRAGGEGIALRSNARGRLLSKPCSAPPPPNFCARPTGTVICGRDAHGIIPNPPPPCRSLASTLSLPTPAGGSPVAVRRSTTAASGADSVRSEDTGRFTALFPELLGGSEEGQGEAEAGPGAGGFVALFPDVEDQVGVAAGADDGAPGQEREGQLLSSEGEEAQPASAAAHPAQRGESF